MNPSSNRQRTRRKPDAKAKDGAAAAGNAQAGLVGGQISQIIQNEQQLREDCAQSERVIQKLTKFSGSVGFVWFHVLLFSIWILGNTLFPSSMRWDPFPFTFLTLIVSLEAIFLSIFILVTTNRDAAITDRRLHLDLQINLLAEKENTLTLSLLTRIAERLGIPLADSPEAKALAAQTDPTKILAEIDENLKQNGNAGTNSKKS